MLLIFPLSLHQKANLLEGNIVSVVLRLRNYYLSLFYMASNRRRPLFLQGTFYLALATYSPRSFFKE